MRSFKKILNERRSEEIEKLRRMSSSAYTGSQMRSQNPEATAAFEREVERRQSRTIKTPEGDVITNMPSGSRTPEEEISRAETNQRRNRRGKKRLRNPKTSKNVVNTTPTPTTSTTNTATTSKSNQLPKLDLDKYNVKTPDPIKPVIASTRNASTARNTSTSSTQRIASTVKDILKTEREAKAAERAARRASLASGSSKFLKNLGRASAILGSGLEAKIGYETARGQGASQRTAAAIGGFRGAGSLAGAATGARIGGLVAGLPGAVVGGVGGYTMGTNAADAIARSLRGDFGKQFNTKDLQRNIRSTVPYEIRRQIPANLRQNFSGFLTRAGRTYGNWRRSQEKGGNK